MSLFEERVDAAAEEYDRHFSSRTQTVSGAGMRRSAMRAALLAADAVVTEPVDYSELIAEAREFLVTPNLGKSLMRELDKAMIYIRRLVDALEVSLGERDATVAAIERVRVRHEKEPVNTNYGGTRDICLDCEQSWPCPTIRALDGAPEPEGVWGYRARTGHGRVVAQGSLDEIGHLSGHIWERRLKTGPWLPVEGESK